MRAHLKRRVRVIAFDACHAAGSFFAIIAEFFFRQADRIMTSRNTFEDPIDPDPGLITRIKAGADSPHGEPHK